MLKHTEVCVWGAELQRRNLSFSGCVGGGSRMEASDKWVDSKMWGRLSKPRFSPVIAWGATRGRWIHLGGVHLLTNRTRGKESVCVKWQPICYSCRTFQSSCFPWGNKRQKSNPRRKRGRWKRKNAAIYPQNIVNKHWTNNKRFQVKYWVTT